MNFFKKIGIFIARFYCFMIITALCLLSTLDLEDKNQRVNGFVALLAWIILIFVMIKISAIASLVISIILYLAAFFYTKGINGEFNSDQVLRIILFVIIVLIYLKFAKSTIKGIKTGSSKDGNSYPKSSQTCPRCGHIMMSVPSQNVITGFETVESGGHWEYDYSTSQTRSYWVKDYKQIPTYSTNKAHYECPGCGYKG